LWRKSTITFSRKDKNMTKASQMMLSALAGWAAAIVTVLGWSYLWPKILPVTGRASALPGSWKLLLFALLFITPFGLVGGVIAGRLPYEGGRREQLLYAALGGAAAALIFGSCAFWYGGW
jgi:ABC-type dipeptide/oligopeptide/nickel transport system permease component